MAIAIKTLERENARISKVAMEQKKKKEQDPHLITKIGQCHRCRQLVHRGSRHSDWDCDNMIMKGILWYVYPPIAQLTHTVRIWCIRDQRVRDKTIQLIKSNVSVLGIISAQRFNLVAQLCCSFRLIAQLHAIELSRSSSHWVRESRATSLNVSIFLSYPLCRSLSSLSSSLLLSSHTFSFPLLAIETKLHHVNDHTSANTRSHQKERIWETNEIRTGATALVFFVWAALQAQLRMDFNGDKFAGCCVKRTNLLK